MKIYKRLIKVYRIYNLQGKITEDLTDWLDEDQGLKAYERYKEIFKCSFSTVKYYEKFQLLGEFKA